MKKLLTILTVVLALCLLCGTALATDENYIGRYTEDEILAMTTVDVKGVTYTIDSTNLATVKANNGHAVDAAVKIYYTDGGKQWFVTATVNVNPHVWDAGTVTTQPTCISKGVTTYKCTVSGCKETKTENKPDKLAGHDTTYWINKTKVEPTCIADGASATYCSKCKVWIPDTEATIDRTYSHAYGWKLVEKPNCGPNRTFPKNGKMSKVCQYCGKLASDLDPVNYPAATNTNVEINYYQMQANSWIKDDSYDGHDWVNWVPGDEPTCAKAGTELRWCKICQLKQEREDASRPALPHAMAVQNPETITCISTSVTFYCTRKGCTYTETKSTHNWADDKVFSNDKTVFVTPKHVYVEDNAYYDMDGAQRKVYPATCTTPAFTLQHCKYEGAHPASLVGFGLTGELPHYQGKALGHDWTEWQCIAAPGASGNEEGLWVRTCRRCTKIEQHASALPPSDLCKEHNAVVDEEKSVKATCTEAGTTYYKCSVCGIALEDLTVEVPATDHDWDVTVKVEPTCAKEGKGNRICKNCGKAEIDVVLDKVAHTWDEGKITKEATKEADGEKTFTCTVCGETKTEAVKWEPAKDPKYTMTASYNGTAVTGKLVHDDSTVEAAAKFVRVTFYVEGNYYMATMAEVEADGTFSVDGVGPIVYITAVATGNSSVNPEDVKVIAPAVEIFVK
jgi:hypothetical protein